LFAFVPRFGVAGPIENSFHAGCAARSVTLIGKSSSRIDTEGQRSNSLPTLRNRSMSGPEKESLAGESARPTTKQSAAS
jgi:hypothetical protein